MPLIPIRRGQGVWLEDFDGRRYLDAISSWWVNLFGHANPVIGAAVAQQLAELEHVIFAGFTHEPAVEVAEALLKLAPPGLARCFFADNGSAAIEVAVKMSFHYWRNSGKPEEALHHAGQQLSRRNARRARGGQRRALQGHLRAAADGRHHRALAGTARARRNSQRSGPARNDRDARTAGPARG